MSNSDLNRTVVEKEKIEALTELIIETINKVGIGNLHKIDIKWDSHRSGKDAYHEDHRILAPDISITLKNTTP